MQGPGFRRQNWRVWVWWAREIYHKQQPEPVSANHQGKAGCLEHRLCCVRGSAQKVPQVLSYLSLGVSKRGYCCWLIPETVLPFSSAALHQHCARWENESYPLHSYTGFQRRELLTGAPGRPERTAWQCQQLACCPGSHLQLQLLLLFATLHPELAPEACPLESVNTTQRSPEERGQESAPSWPRKGLGEISGQTWTCRVLRGRWPGVLSISQ